MSENTAQRLIKLREKYNYSQTDVAKLIGATPALISAYEKMERNPSIEKLLKLADIFHTTTDYLLGREAISNLTTVLDVEGLSPAQVQALRTLVDTMRQTKKEPG